MSSNSGQIGPLTTDLAALWHLKINFFHLLSIRSFIIYQLTRTCNKFWMSLNEFWPDPESD